MIHVKMGEVKLGTRGAVLQATLGSCVGIAFLWRAKDRFALAHCLLPAAPTPTPEIGARYVSQAISSLVGLMNITPEDIASVEVHLAGGGNMLAQLSRQNVEPVGKLNVAAATSRLAELGFKIKEMDVGGEQGREMSVDCSSGAVSVKTFSKSA